MGNLSKTFGKLTILLLLLLAICFSALPAQAKYGGGTGEPNDPYLIFDANQMNAIGANRDDWDKHFLLCADIDLSAYTGTSFNIIGEHYYDSGWVINPFTGVFDGSSHTISNFTYCSYAYYAYNIGLFGYVRWGAEIKDLGLIDPNIDAGTGRYVGSLVGYLNGGTITNCYAGGGSISGASHVGGLVGKNEDTIFNCYSTASVSGFQVGGLVGSNSRFGTIDNCYAAGDVSGTWYVGGLVGLNFATITNCCASASVSGVEDVGGLVGYNGSNGSNGTITNSYSTGRVSGTAYVGGLVGYNRGGGATNSFWDIETSGQRTSDGGTGKTTAEMQTQSTFTDAGWDFMGETANGTDDIWRLCEAPANYPQLNWRFPLGDFLCPDGVDFIDYSFFASHWLEDNCGSSNDCEGTDLDQLGTVNINDLGIFVGNWLAGPLPGQASNPNPLDGAVGVSTTVDLGWTVGAFATSHDVYFGTSSPPSFIGNQIATTFEPGTMPKNTTYYWRIDEVNPWGTNTGAVWSFTTESEKAYSPDPGDGSLIDGENYPPDHIFVTLSFDAGMDANTHEVFFSDDIAKVIARDETVSLGEAPDGNFPTTYYAGVPLPEWTPYNDSLVRGTTYYWCADETDSQGQLWQGSVWSFTVRLNEASNPDPHHEETLVSTTTVLSWSQGAETHEHDIYFGTNEAAVTDANMLEGDPEYRGTQRFGHETWDPTAGGFGPLDYETDYYWRIDEVHGRCLFCFPIDLGTIITGDVWSFTTGVPSPP